MSERVMNGHACTRCGAEPAEMVPDGFGERGQLFRCADVCSPTVIECAECGDLFAGGRTAARAAHWEPFSTASQRALDFGPIVCPGCIKKLLDELVGILRSLR